MNYFTIIIIYAIINFIVKFHVAFYTIANYSCFLATFKTSILTLYYVQVITHYKK